MDARWTIKHGKSYSGDKLHANVDRCCGLIRQYEVSPANEHDSRHFETLLDAGNTRKRVSGDSAYSDKAREAALKAQGYQVDICRKGARKAPLSAAQQRRNHRIAKDGCLWSTPLHGCRSRAGSACARSGWRVRGE